MKLLRILISLLSLSCSAREHFPTPDQAAIAFVQYANSRSESDLFEFCSFIIQVGSSFSFLEPAIGNQNGCKLPNENSSIVIGNIHTHPRRFGGNDLSAEGQLPSTQDLLFAANPRAGKFSYLGAPAGHIVKYGPQSIRCRGRSWLQIQYELIQQPNSTARGELEFSPSAWRALDPTQPSPFCNSK